VTKSESEPSVAEQEIRPSVAHDSEEPLHTNGSIEEPTTTNARVNEPVVSRPEVEESAVPPKVDSVEEQLANTSEPEPLVEGAVTPALEETIPIVEESVETPVVVEEPDLSTVEALVNTNASSEAPVEPADAATTSETSIPILAEEPFFVFEAAPAAETPIETLTPVIDEPMPAFRTDSLTTAEIPVGTPAEEPIHAATDVAPAAEIPVESPPTTGELDPTPQALAGKDAPVGIPTAAVEDSIPVAEVATLPAEIIAEAQATTTDGAIPISQESVLADPGDLVDIPAPTMERLVPANEEVAQAATSPMETSACVVEESHFAEDAIPTAEMPADTPVSMVEQSILVTDEAVHAAETPASEIQAPAIEVSQAAALNTAEPEVLTETLVPATEEQTAIIEEAPPAADICAENLTFVVEEATPVSQAIVPAESPAETTVPLAEEAANADTPAETLAVDAIPTAIEAPPAPSETAVHIQAEASEPAFAPETGSHAEAPPPATEAPAAPIPEERSLVIDDVVETPSETVPPPAEECASLDPEETEPATTEAAPDVDVAPVAEDPAPVSADTPSDLSVPMADEPAPTLGQSVSPVAEVPAPVPEESAPVPEEAEPVFVEVEHRAETTPVAGESTASTTEEEPVREENTSEASLPTPDAEQPLTQEDSAARSTEDQVLLAEEHLSDQPETVVAESLQATEQVVPEPVPLVDGEAPATATEELVVQEPEGVPGAETVTAPEVDAPAEAPMSNGTDVRHADPGEAKSFLF
jgi:hypothetical protein